MWGKSKDYYAAVVTQKLPIIATNDDSIMDNVNMEIQPLSKNKLQVPKVGKKVI